MLDDKFLKTGVASNDMVLECFPSEARLNKGPVAVIECYMRIPCNPCETVCRFKAIHIGDDINNIPVLDAQKCTGCGICLTKCPGLSIIILNASRDKGEAIDMKIPYEFLPLPQKDDIVDALDRSGNFVTRARVVSVTNPPSFDKTPVITITFDRRYMYDVRNIRVSDLSVKEVDTNG